mmetsp:Transcript_53566/g.148963  ORF Transcript_53566/g.148963 Transcript_53566/m.148963 type:complete len:190 (-) Transcript_53566:112-681(-)
MAMNMPKQCKVTTSLALVIALPILFNVAEGSGSGSNVGASVNFQPAVAAFEADSATPARGHIQVFEALDVRSRTALRQSYTLVSTTGGSLGTIILVAILVIIVLAGLFLLWGGSMKQLEQNPAHALEATAQSIYSDPRAASQRTQAAVARDTQQYGSMQGWAQHELSQAQQGMQRGRQTQPSNRQFGCC